MTTKALPSTRCPSRRTSQASRRAARNTSASLTVSLIVPLTNRDTNETLVGAHVNSMEVALAAGSVEPDAGHVRHSSASHRWKVAGIAISVIAMVGMVDWLIARRDRSSEATHTRERSFTEVFGRAEDVEMQSVSVPRKTAQIDGYRV